MWRDIPELLVQLDVLAPTDFYACFAEFMTEMNGRLDRDNLGYRVVTNAKLSAGSTDRIVYAEATAPVAMAPPAPSSASELTLINTAVIDAEEEIIVRASGWCESTGADQCKIEFYLCVDNVIVAALEPMRLRANSTYEMEWAGPVVGGTHTIDVLAMITRYYRGTVGAISANAVCGSLVVMERRR